MDRFTNEELQAELQRRTGERIHLPVVKDDAAEITSFDEFWSRYPRKVGKKDAARAWWKLTNVQRLRALESIDGHVWMWVQEGRGTRLIPHAATWLNGWRFDDEINFVPERSTTPTANTRTNDVLGKLERS